MSGHSGGGKVITAVIAFILGFVFAFLVEVGAVLGVYFYVSTTDIETLFGVLGVQNRDDDGNYLYLNTDGENGGAETLGDLVKLLMGYLYSEGSSSMDFPILGKSIDDISNLLPVVQRTLAAQLYPLVEPYVDVDWETFEKTPMTELVQFISDAALDIRPAQLLRKLNMGSLVDGEDANAIVKALLAGAEFDYAYYGTAADGTGGLKFPVFFDTYNYNERLDSYFRVEGVDGQEAFPAGLDTNLLYDSGTTDDNGNRIYNLYYVPVNYNGGDITDPLRNDPLPKDAKDAEKEAYTFYQSETSFYAVTYNESTDEYILDADRQYVYPTAYGLHYYDRTGNYYYDNAGEEIQVKPVTIRSFQDPNEIFKPLYGVRITELMQGEIMEAMFGRHSVGELLDQKINIDECVDNLELSKVMAIDPEDKIMAYIGYGLTNVEKAGIVDDKSIYTGNIDIDGVSTPCKIEAVVEGKPAKMTIKRVWYEKEDGSGGKVEVDVKGTTVKGVADKAANIEMPALLEVKADDAILCYIGYGLSSVTADAGSDDGHGNAYTHTGKYEAGGSEFTAYIKADPESKKITDAWYYDTNGDRISIAGTTVNQVSGRVSSLTEKLAITDVLDVTADQNITVYIGYGITGIAEKSGEDGLNNAYTHTGKYKVGDDEFTAYIKADPASKKITEAWYLKPGGDSYEKVIIPGTSIKGVTERMQNVTEALALSDVIEIKADQKITVYVGYGITGLFEEEGIDGLNNSYSYTGVYRVGEVDYTAYVNADKTSKKITEAWYLKPDGVSYEKVIIPGTTIKGVTDRMANIQEELTLPDVLDINADQNITVYIGYGITGAKQESNSKNGYAYAYKGKYKLTDGSEVQAYMATNAAGVITKAWYFDESSGEPVMKNIKGTAIGKISERIEGITEAITLPDVMEVTADQKITVYIGYGITGVIEESGRDSLEEAYSYKGKYKLPDGSSVEAYFNADKDSKEITEAWYIKDGAREDITGTTIKGVTDKIDGIPEALALPDVLDIQANQSITVYIGYGITGAKEQSGDGYTYVGKYKVGEKEYEAFINADKDSKKIISAWYTDESGEKVILTGTTISEIPEKIENISGALALSDVLDIEAGQKITVYMGYGITGVVEDSGNHEGVHTHRGVYAAGGKEYTAYMATFTDSASGKTIISEAWYLDGDNKRVDIAGTTIKDVSTRIEGISEALALGDFLDVQAGQKITVYIGYGITGVVGEPGTDSLDNAYTHKGKYTPQDESETDAYINTDSKGNITEAWYIKDGVRHTIPGTKIGEVPKRIEGISANLTLADVMDIDEDEKILYALRDSKISDIGKNVGKLTLGQILDERSFANSAILQQLRNTNIDNMSTAIDNISIQSIYADEIYVEKVEGVSESQPAQITEATVYNSEQLYFVNTGDESSPVYEYVTHEGDADGDYLGMLTEAQFNQGRAEGKKYFTYGTPKGMWRLILMASNPGGEYTGKYERVYTLNNLHNMINHSAQNVYNATLGELKDAKIIGSTVDLSGTLVYGSGQKKVLKDITLQELINIVVEMTKGTS